MLSKRGAGVQVRAMSRRGWSKEVRASFLDMLAATCNVSAAARAVGKHTRAAYELKRRDGEFATLWAHAFDQGRERLHERLIAQALGQEPTGDNPDGERQPPDAVPFDANLAIQVLKLQDGTWRRRKAGAAPLQVEIDAALLTRLEAMAQRLADR